MSMELRGTTICAVRKNGHTSIAGDGQVTMGQSVIFKSHAHKVRRLYGGQVVIGFALWRMRLPCAISLRKS